MSDLAQRIAKAIEANWPEHFDMYEMEKVIDRELSVPIRTNSMSKAIALVLGELEGIPRQADDTTSFRIGKAIAALSKLHKELSVPSTEGHLEQAKYWIERAAAEAEMTEPKVELASGFAKRAGLYLTRHLLGEGKEEKGVAPSAPLSSGVPSPETGGPADAALRPANAPSHGPWISVDERLPKDDIMVPVAKGPVIMGSTHYRSKGRWIRDGRHEAEQGITHWVDLPVPQ